jgi:hypothetical protein
MKWDWDAWVATSSTIILGSREPKTGYWAGPTTGIKMGLPTCQAQPIINNKNRYPSTELVGLEQAGLINSDVGTCTYSILT